MACVGWLSSIEWWQSCWLDALLLRTQRGANGSEGSGEGKRSANEMAGGGLRFTREGIMTIRQGGRTSSKVDIQRERVA